MVATNSRYVSVKQGVDFTANQEEISEHETFHLEFDAESEDWFLRTRQDKYFSLQPSGGVQANQSKKVLVTLFEILWGEGCANATKRTFPNLSELTKVHHN